MNYTDQNTGTLYSSETEKNDPLNPVKDRHILIAVDESESSKRAGLYVADFLGDSPGFRATILHLISIPEMDEFRSDEEREKWIAQRRDHVKAILDTYRRMLIQAGFPEEKVEVRIVARECLSIAEVIIEEQHRLGSCTVVVARHRISRQEEFLFGSTTNKLLHMPKSCSLWIIE
ncbi:MAG: hypothetical protein COZ32_03335 [Nitrospirae bacterium CG_4_10_14_3_um_filter_53_41]|nr:MAG: hypothetical protein AUK29_02295 [Nitrospirae bacterium CG2_30_53_67]PIV82453.1 MAG: hypothetical protein COW52_13475 [Nitrospirae bacterium CG17_big_fil_post_rev_8_21_14_2_50_50_9]PIX86436.1 MAG: hypothetical protein COZ32_03335 [Nitrospirae bacterium CG_4_10_14_3_um_filter_53_41]